jgi:hypothetical protein
MFLSEKLCGESAILGMNGTYGAFMYTAHHLTAIQQFKSSGKDALFMYMAFQNTHSPYVLRCRVSGLGFLFLLQ